MKKKDLEKLKSLLGSGDSPSIEEIREFRRRLAAEPDSGEWPQKLIRIENGLENGELNYRDIQEELNLEMVKQNRITIRMDEREPFPDCRRQILDRQLQNVGGRSTTDSDDELKLVIPNSAAEHRIRALSHWIEVNREDRD